MYFNILFYSGIVIALLFTLGVHTRITGVLNFIFVWSLYERNPFVLDGGNNILIICLFFLMFANVGAYFTLFKTKRNKNRYIAALHNTSIIACIIQVAILYSFSGIFKAQGDMWFNGVALYYILQVSEFTLPGIAEYIYSNPIMLTIGTYSTVIFQIAFPFLILNKTTKWVMISILVMFHLGIAIVMGLVSFGLTMICLDLLLFNDKFYKRNYFRYRKFRRKITNKRTIKQFSIKLLNKSR
ncbi:HTTM domain-containing protein [Piscibacillus salipiscarius]|uniref:HTTM domain-containing protein n=1 Tax=Piscibacillus salipiscarius TaxID=299480 RepID=UPI0024364045|nr:HTTM domain-containing protein [Piscibacillus salipiscarius]